LAHARRHVLADGIRALNPDLIALQEAIVNAQCDQVNDLLGSEYHVYHQQQRENPPRAQRSRRSVRDVNERQFD
jgi:hypothetical protein